MYEKFLGRLSHLRKSGKTDGGPGARRMILTGSHWLWRFLTMGAC